MYKRLFGWGILANIILVLLVPTILSTPLTDETPYWDESWSFREKITIPIDTSNEHAKYQPIDIYFEFDDICWAVDENEHSIRVCFWDGFIWHELESQVYNLIHTDDKHISSCNLVFLIPAEADGEESYYIYYDEDSKPSQNYPNHVDIIESQYRYEQIPGMPLESSYFGIIEEDYIVYAVNKEGTFLGQTITQQIAKLKPGTENVEPKSAEIGASFGFTYWWTNDWAGAWPHSSTTERLAKYQKIIDGNLMVKFGIESESNDGLLRSTVIYTYYYCPTGDKRISVHAKHEVIDYPLPRGKEIEATYIEFMAGKVKSNTIEDLNFGNIPPYLHFYSEEERIVKFDLDQHPEGVQSKIEREDDYDLGSHPWVSFDEGETGKAHAVIFETNNILKSGDNERDGIELLLYEANKIRFPGLDNRVAVLYFNRNCFENGEETDEELPENYVLEFNAEFFTTEKGGYPEVEEEAKMYKKLVQYQPSHNNNITGDGEKIDKFNLTAFVHFAPTVPIGSFLSAGLGLNTAYISAEVYKENNEIPSAGGTVSRICLSDIIPANFEDLTFIEKVITFTKLIDWKNFSFFKKVFIPKLEEGRYLIKIFRENTVNREGRQFIGYTIVNLDGDKVTHIYCKCEGKVRLSFLNQDKAGIEDVQVSLKKDDFIIAKSESDSDGKVTLRAPSGFKEEYTLNVTYKGFLISEEQIRLGLISRIIPSKKDFSFNVYDLDINLKDSDGNAPDFNVDFSITSKEMVTPISLKPDSVSSGSYKFKGLYPANYSLTIKYNSFEIKEEIQIPNVESMSINLYDFKTFITDSWNLSPGAPLDVFLTSKDFEKNVVMSGKQLSLDEYHFSNLYPGYYVLKARYKSYTVEENVRIPDDEKIMIMFPAEFNFTATVLDSHGCPLKGARFVMIRGEKEIQGVTDDNGELMLSLPPGSYVNKIFYGEDLIAQRKVEVLNEMGYEIVTTNEPLQPYIVIGLIVALFAGVTIFSFRKKDKLLFLKILAVSLAVIAIVSPWYELQGHSEEPHLETSTRLFLIPSKVTTITSNNNILAGEILPIDDNNIEKEIDIIFTTIVVKFVTVMDVLSTIILVGCIFVISGVIAGKYFKRSLPYAISLSAIILFVGAIAMFYIALSEMAVATFGSFTGGNYLDINIPGESMYETLSCSWGPSIGFYLVICSTIIMIIAFILSIRKKIIKSRS